jgi:hypothetical protein
VYLSDELLWVLGWMVLGEHNRDSGHLFALRNAIT